MPQILAGEQMRFCTEGDPLEAGINSTQALRSCVSRTCTVYRLHRGRKSAKTGRNSPNYAEHGFLLRRRSFLWLKKAFGFGLFSCCWVFVSRAKWGICKPAMCPLICWALGLLLRACAKCKTSPKPTPSQFFGGLLLCVFFLVFG